MNLLRSRLFGLGHPVRLTEGEGRITMICMDADAPLPYHVRFSDKSETGRWVSEAEVLGVHEHIAPAFRSFDVIHAVTAPRSELAR